MNILNNENKKMRSSDFASPGYLTKIIYLAELILGEVYSQSIPRENQLYSVKEVANSYWTDICFFVFIPFD